DLLHSCEKFELAEVATVERVACVSRILELGGGNHFDLRSKAFATSTAPRSAARGRLGLSARTPTAASPRISVASASRNVLSAPPEYATRSRPAALRTDLS